MEVHVGHCSQSNKPSKTEALFVSAPPSSYAVTTTFDNKNLQSINLGNSKFLLVVTRFSYLGTNLNTYCRNNENVVFRIKNVGSAFGALRKCLFSNSNMSVVAKRAVYEGLTLPILLNGAEPRCLTEKLFPMLRIFHHRCVRSVCRVTLTQCYNFRITNGELLRRLNLRTIDDYVTKRQLRWAGHVARIDFDRLPRKMLPPRVCTKHLVGAPEYTYGRDLFKSLKKAGSNLNIWRELAHNKTKWRKMVYEILFWVYYYYLVFLFIYFIFFCTVIPGK